ncbi:hypothetical protein C9374_001205 [Naegleria lovaniensis]|uniref:Uncharacterized protein n=1 Tax=Naegleria lovaniensis TaxID=51637 RepID=A0AA88KNI6_NAELO|nr:uncharacterized protein C9374_001205 [Naegleria lovaniensis]KAG2387611.1 hypothetical protein C9374_001205 [Naegleria lovaniensis]
MDVNRQEGFLLRATWQACNEEYRNDEIKLFQRLVHVEDASTTDHEENDVEKGPVVFEKQKEPHDDSESKYFEITIELNELFEWTAIDVYSTARNIELYTSMDREYSQTCRFTEKVGEGSAYQYHCICTSESHQDGISKKLPMHSKFVIKFLSLDYCERAFKQTKICVSAIVLHGIRKGPVTSSSSAVSSSSLSHNDTKESTQFSGSMSTLMSDPRMLMSLMNGMIIHSVEKEREKEIVSQPQSAASDIIPKPVINEAYSISSNVTPQVISENIISSSYINQFSTKEELRSYVNECVDARMKEWEEKITNKIISELIGKVATLNPSGMSGLLSSFFSGPKLDPKDTGNNE